MNDRKPLRLGDERPFGEVRRARGSVCRSAYPPHRWFWTIRGHGRRLLRYGWEPTHAGAVAAVCAALRDEAGR